MAMHILISSLSRFTRPTGICRHAASLARCLAGRPEVERVTLVVGAWQETYFHATFELASPKIQVLAVSLPNTSLARNRWFAFGLPELARRLKPSLIHLGFPVPIFRQGFPAPVVATVHDLYPFDDPASLRPFPGWCKRIFFRRCMAACDAVVCVSQSTRGNLLERFPALAARVPVHVVHNYADLVPLADPPEDDPRPFLLAVAQHQPNKRLDVLLRAFARLRAENPAFLPYRLLIVGSPGSQSEALRQLAETLHLTPRVHWMPPVSDHRLAWLYRHCSVFIANSSMEGFCLPLLEALSLNCRVVASDLPVFYEIAGAVPTYFSLTPDPLANLCAAIDRAMRREVSSAQPPLTRFSRTTAAAGYLNLYAQVLRGYGAEPVTEASPAPSRTDG
ncbi:MAG: glycosyltransferase family 1 protein [Acidobacteriota bacterium]|nr:glycosyltransferase family 1 protein [Acidobacteriota bacterium]